MQPPPKDPEAGRGPSHKGLVYGEKTLCPDFPWGHHLPDRRQVSVSFHPTREAELGGGGAVCHVPVRGRLTISGIYLAINVPARRHPTMVGIFCTCPQPLCPKFRLGFTPISTGVQWGRALTA